MAKEEKKHTAYGALARKAYTFVRYLVRRFRVENGPRTAASLSYTSLLALVPLLTIGFAMIAAFPAFEEARIEVRAFLFENLLPSAGEEAIDYFDGFIANAGKLTAIGTAFLAITAVMLFSTIEAAINQIFRVRTRRGLLSRLLIYWAALTIGPLILATSFTLSSYLMRMTRVLGDDSLNGLDGLFLRALPAALLVAAFTLLYLVLPNRRVRLGDAAIGGLVAGLGFAGLRWAFGMYVIYFPSYQTIYGAVAAVPLLLVWMYLSWMVVLFGGVVTASIAVWRSGLATVSGQAAPVSLVGGARLVAALVSAQRAGEPPYSRAKLIARCRLAPGLVERILERLSAAGFVVRTNSGGWVFTRDAATTSLHDLFVALELDSAMAPLDGGRDDAFSRRIGAVLDAVAGDRRARMGISLASLLSEDAVPADVARLPSTPGSGRGREQDRTGLEQSGS